MISFGIGDIRTKFSCSGFDEFRATHFKLEELVSFTSLPFIVHEYLICFHIFLTTIQSHIDTKYTFLEFIFRHRKSY